MGIKNSSKTRVGPVFSQLIERDATGCSWLPLLLRLPKQGSSFDQTRYPALSAISEAAWDPKEKKLDPPVSLLSWLLRNVSRPKDGKLGKDPTTVECREKLLARDPATVQRALRNLRCPPKDERPWYVFEGQSSPDVYLETPELVVVIEGKRTENKPTKTTSWLPGRDQMLRHMDAAWEVRGERPVLGFFIVDSDLDSGQVPKQWLEFCKETVSHAAIEKSFPHRSEEEREAIVAGFLGIATWQQVCVAFDIDLAALPDTVADSD